MNDFEEHGQVVLGRTIICLILSRVRTQHEFARFTTKVHRTLMKLHQNLYEENVCKIECVSFWFLLNLMNINLSHKIV